jgi:hypothetical protein
VSPVPTCHDGKPDSELEKRAALDKRYGLTLAQQSPWWASRPKSEMSASARVKSRAAAHVPVDDKTSWKLLAAQPIRCQALTQPPIASHMRFPSVIAGLLETRPRWR